MIALTGGAMVGAKADPQQIHRWAELQALCGIEAGDPLDWALFHQLLSHPEGLFKGTRPGRAGSGLSMGIIKMRRHGSMN